MEEIANELPEVGIVRLFLKAKGSHVVLVSGKLRWGDNSREKVERAVKISRRLHLRSRVGWRADVRPPRDCRWSTFHCQSEFQQLSRDRGSLEAFHCEATLPPPTPPTHKVTLKVPLNSIGVAAGVGEHDGCIIKASPDQPCYPLHIPVPAQKWVLPIYFERRPNLFSIMIPPGAPLQSSSTGVESFFSLIFSYFCAFVLARRPCTYHTCHTHTKDNFSSAIYCERSKQSVKRMCEAL